MQTLLRVLPTNFHTWESMWTVWPQFDYVMHAFALQNNLLWLSSPNWLEFSQLAVLECALTHKQLELHGCILSTVATDGLALKHQAISIHSADWIFIVFHRFHEIVQS